MKKLLRLGFTKNEIEDLKNGCIIRKDNDFNMIEYQIVNHVYEDLSSELRLQESHSGYGKTDFWTEWEDVTSKIQF